MKTLLPENVLCEICGCNLVPSLGSSLIIEFHLPKCHLYLLPIEELPFCPEVVLVEADGPGKGDAGLGSPQHVLSTVAYNSIFYNQDHIRSFVLSVAQMFLTLSDRQIDFLTSCFADFSRAGSSSSIVYSTDIAVLPSVAVLMEFY
jgi:hypothetical protein